MKKNTFFNHEEIDNQKISKDQTQDSRMTTTSSVDSHGNPMNEYSDQIFVSESNAKELMFDRKNPIVRLILLVLGLVALLGTVYYIYIFITTMR